MDSIIPKSVSFHKINHPFRTVKNSNSLHRTSAGLRSKITQDELPVINDFYLSDLSISKPHTLHKHHMSDLRKIINPENESNHISHNQKIFERLPSTLREFLIKKKDFMALIDNFDKISYCNEKISEKIKCYRAELGNLLEKTQNSYATIFEKVLNSSMNLFLESEERSKTQIACLLKRIETLETEKKELKIKNDKLQTLNHFQESEYKICKMSLDSLQTELVLLHELLKRDVSSLINHVGVIENVNQKVIGNTDLSDKLGDLNDLIGDLENEQSNKRCVLDSMNNLLKAMLKGAKTDFAAQVDEVELLWQAQTIEKTDPKLIRYPSMIEIEGSCLNFDQMKYSYPELNTIDVLKLKEKELNKEIIEEKEKAMIWSLPASLMVFLENIMRNNEGGRVLPWQHFRKIIFKIYTERVNFQNEIKGCLLNNGLAFDEFLCLYFIKSYKLRRMAELKLLEFLVSLKYYSKQSPRALLLANLCNIIPYAKPLQESFPYNFDLYTQEYFFYIFSKIIIGEASSIIEYNDTQTLLKNEKLDEISKTLLCFAPEIDQKHFLSKLTRLIKKVECPNGEVFEGVDVDKIFDSSIEEFFESKKKKFKTLTKKFSKMYETDNGLLSFDDFKFLLSEVSDLPSPLEKYTFANEILKLKCYIYSITSGKNKNDIIYKDFIGSVLKFGMDCPFPFVKNKKKNYNFIQKTEDEKKEEGKVLSRNHTKEDSLIEKSIDGKSFTSLNQGVIESSALFGQHFALLRELKGYCTQFKEAVDKETNTEVLLKHFDNISEILNVACQFFKFPIKI